MLFALKAKRTWSTAGTRAMRAPLADSVVTGTRPGEGAARGEPCETQGAKNSPWRDWGGAVVLRLCWCHFGRDKTSRRGPSGRRDETGPVSCTEGRFHPAPDRGFPSAPFRPAGYQRWKKLRASSPIDRRRPRPPNSEGSRPVRSTPGVHESAASFQEI